jgi:hypothetical protein
MASAFAQTYHPNDKEGLRTFLRQPSAIAGQINAERLGLAISDTLNWQIDEAWVDQVIDLYWNTETPKRLTVIGPTGSYGWGFGNLAGNLDATKWTELTHLSCGSNSLTSLDVSNNTALIYLVCGLNQLTNLDVNNTTVAYLDCGSNSLTSLDVSGNTALTELHCSSNQLTSLDLSSNTALTSLYCFNNQLTSLDLSNNKVFKSLSCSNNQLTSLDLSNNPVLTTLSCFNNQLTSLDVSSALIWLNCGNNQLALSDLYMVSEILESNETEIDYRNLGTQTLPTQSVAVDIALFSSQSVFNGIFTNYSVTQNDTPAPENGYTISDGKITFHKLGIYTVTMTNEAIISSEDYPAEVIVELTVTNMGINECGLFNIKVYPNPTSGQLRIENGELKIENAEIYDVYGKIQKVENWKTKNAIDISHFPTGVYFLKISTEAGEVTRKVLKE